MCVIKYDNSLNSKTFINTWKIRSRYVPGRHKHASVSRS